jgi:hypothetical protein
MKEMHMDNAREILEIAKAAGQANIVPGYKLFIREYFRKGQIVDLVYPPGRDCKGRHIS